MCGSVPTLSGLPTLSGPELSRVGDGAIGRVPHVPRPACPAALMSRCFLCGVSFSWHGRPCVVTAGSSPSPPPPPSCAGGLRCLRGPAPHRHPAGSRALPQRHARCCRSDTRAAAAATRAVAPWYYARWRRTNESLNSNFLYQAQDKREFEFKLSLSNSLWKV